MRTVVLVSPQFPPSPLAGAHRARHLARHLPAFGWHPIVLSVDARDYAEPPDVELARLLPRDLEQVRVRALSAAAMRALGIGDIGLRAYRPLGEALDRIVAERAPDVVFFTGFPFYPFLLAPRLKHRYRVPVVLDFQDPWVSDYGATRPALSKEGIAHRLATRLEPKALRAADYVTSVSHVQNAAMAARYSWLDAGHMAAIPIGADPEEFAAVRDMPPPAATQILERGFIHLNYVGAFWPRAEPVFCALFRGLARLRQREPGVADRLRLNFFGTYSNVSGQPVEQVVPIARSEGVADLVREAPRRLPYLDALGVTAHSDGLLLIGSDEPHYTASKIYGALMSGRPFLSIFHRASSAHAVLAAAGGGIALSFAARGELAAMEPAAAGALHAMATAPQSFGALNPAVYATFTAHAITACFARIFDSLPRRANPAERQRL